MEDDEPDFLVFAAIMLLIVGCGVAAVLIGNK